MRGIRHISKNKHLISIIVVGFNARQYLNRCFRSLFAMSYKNIEVFFVDNASSDKSVDFVKKQFPKVIILRNRTNLGFAGGHDIALKKAKGDGILTVNTDSFVEKNLLDVLVPELYKSSDIGMVYPKLVGYPNTKLIDSVGSFFTITGILYHFGHDKDESLPIYNKPMEVYATKGALLIKMDIIKKIGFFDKDYFLYFEETDFCHRLWLAGYRVVYVPNTKNFHEGAGVTRTMKESFIIFHSEKNRICTYIKNLSFGYLWKVLFFVFLIHESSSVFFLLKRRFRNALAIQKAIFWNIFHIRKTLQKRKMIQTRIRKAQDQDFLPKLTRPINLRYFYHWAFGGGENYEDKEF